MAPCLCAIQDIDIARGIGDHTVGQVQGRRGGGTAVAVGAPGTGRRPHACEDFQIAGRGDAPDGIEAGLIQVEIPRAVDGQVRNRRQRERRRSAGEILAGGERDAIAGHTGDDPVGVDSPDAIVLRVEEVEVAGGIVARNLRLVEQRAGGRSAVSAEAGHARARNGIDRTIGANAPDHVARVAKYQVAGRIPSDSAEVFEKHVLCRKAGRNPAAGDRVDGDSRGKCVALRHPRG